ncbi:MAG: hypothetical protein HC800_25380 [Phormidesmis sp. RL_2_1]|nr:hypothetical protein [Phormidesmis sp. RL_2_1]
MAHFFDLSPVVLLPAGIILVLALLRVNVKVAMAASIGIGMTIAYHYQHYSLLKIIQFSVVGYQLEPATPLQAILLGGGLLAMGKATLVVFLSTAFAGIFSGSQALAFVDARLGQMATQRARSRATILVAILANLFGCSKPSPSC